MHRRAGRAQCGRYRIVARECGRFVVFVEEERIGVQAPHEAAQLDLGRTARQREIAAEPAQFVAQGDERREENRYERRAHTLARQQSRIDNDRCYHRPALPTCLEKRHVVVEPQVAPQPDDAQTIALHRRGCSRGGPPLRS